MKKKITQILIILTIGFLVVHYIIEYRNHKKLEVSFQITQGKIINYYEIFPATHYVEYEFFVKGIRYKNKLNPEFELEDCPDSKNCIGMIFPVKYEIGNPSNSTIILGKN